VEKNTQSPDPITIFDALKAARNTIKEPKEDTWGHYPETIHSNTTFCIFFNNPNGLKLTIDPLSVQYSLSLLQDLGAGGICIAEAIINWTNRQVSNNFRTIVRKIWKHSSYTTSHSIGPITGEIQPGGTVTVINNNWTSRIIEKGSDPYVMGRWSYVILRGQDGKRILLVTAYRVCIQVTSSAGPTTSTSQQFRFLSQEFRAPEVIEDPHPRKQFIVDLQA
jgi:hypothetical protein